MKKYGRITLTEKEMKQLKFIKETRNTKKFFEIIGIDERIADEDACKIEHVASSQTIEALTKLIEFMQNPELLERFKMYREKE